MINSKFSKGVITLVISGFLTKILGLVIKIVTTRIIGQEGISIYMLILPTLMLVITLSQLGIPLALSKIIAERNTNKKRIILSTIPVVLTLNIILMVVLIVCAPFLANNLLKNSVVLGPLYLVAFSIPLFSISNIIKSYYIGTQNMFPTMVAHLFEQLIRLFFIMIFLPKALNISLSFAVQAIVVGVMLGESMAIIVMIWFIRKRISFNKSDFKTNRNYIKRISEISIPSTGSRLIGSMSYFLEPILITSILIYIGYSREFIVSQYGIINGYSISLLLLPSFFSYAISTALLPAISNAYSSKNLQQVKTIIFKSIFYSFITGGLATIVIMTFPEALLKAIYNTTSGVEYIRYLGPAFVIYYIQAPLTATLQATGNAKLAMKSTLIGTILKLAIIIVIPFIYNMGMYTLALANVFNILVVTVLHVYKVKKYVLTS